MKFSDFVLRDAIVASLRSTTGEGVIRELVEALSRAGGLAFDRVEEVTQAIVERQKLGAMALGLGVAVPHAKSQPSVERPVCAVGVSRAGVEFGADDHSPVRIFFLLVSPPDRPGEHLRALEQITRRLQSGSFRDALENADDASVLYQLLEDSDSESL